MNQQAGEEDREMRGEKKGSVKKIKILYNLDHRPKTFIFISAR